LTRRVRQRSIFCRRRIQSGAAAAILCGLQPACASYQINKTFQIYARADNIFDNRYATYGTFFDMTAVPNFANGGAAFTDPRFVSPARPRALYVGLKATF
jgi:hypothetical protein